MIRSPRSTCLSLLAVALFACAACADGGKDKAPPPPPPPSSPFADPALGENIGRAVGNAIPGSDVEVTITHKDAGKVKTHKAGTGKGVSAVVEGDKMSDKITGSAPKVGGDDVTAEGGDVDKDSNASAVKVPPVPWQNPLFWVGIACLGGCGFCVYSQLRRAAMVCGVAGAGCLAAAFYPWLLLVAVAAVITVLLLPYIKAELEKLRANEAARAYAEAHSNLTPDAKTEMDTNLHAASTGKDPLTIAAIKVADNLK